jgi:hypothetical protein
MGKIIDGQPTSANFLVRSRNYFADNGLNVAVMGLPSKKLGQFRRKTSIKSRFLCWLCIMKTMVA